MKNYINIGIILLCAGTFYAAQPTEPSLEDLKTQYYEEVELSSAAESDFARLQHTLKAQTLLRRIEIEQHTLSQAREQATVKTSIQALPEVGVISSISAFLVGHPSTKKRSFKPESIDLSYLEPITRFTGLEPAIVSASLSAIQSWLPTIVYAGIAAWGVWRINHLFNAEFALERERLINQFRAEVADLKEKMTKREESNKAFEEKIKAALQEECRINDERAAHTAGELEAAKAHFTQALQSLNEVVTDIPTLQIKQHDIEDLAQKIIGKQQKLIDIVTDMSRRAHEVTAQRLQENSKKATALGLSDDDPLALSVRRRTRERREKKEGVARPAHTGWWPFGGRK